jgi:hypothetical protein
MRKEEIMEDFSPLKPKKEGDFTIRAIKKQRK